jgi:outer membrane protein TolC
LILPRTTLAVVVAMTLTASGCISMQPAPLTDEEIAQRSRDDRQAARADVAPVTGPLTLEEAIARALKYNLDRRTRLMEETIALNQLDLSKYDLLPKLVASAGYTNRSEELVSRAKDSVTGAPSLSNPFISSDREHTLYGLGLTWNLLDFGVSYYNAKQNADRVLIAAERRRKAMHVLIQDVRIAFWRAASAQTLSDDVRRAISLGENALADARTAEAERLRSPLESLRYQRQLLENLRLLEAIDQELSTARVELAHLINAPFADNLAVVEPSDSLSKQLLDMPVEQMEELAITRNADLREQHYNARIARDEARKTIVKLFPSLSFSYAAKRDTDSFLVNNRWNEAGVQLSYNLFGLLSVPAQKRFADAGVTLADQRRVATQMAVLAQVHLARLQFANAWQQYDRADAIWHVDDKINQHVTNRERAQTQSKLEQVANNTTAILSLLRRYQSLAQAHAAASRLQATLGLELNVGSVQETSLQDLTAAVTAAFGDWNRVARPATPPTARSKAVRTPSRTSTPPSTGQISSGKKDGVVSASAADTGVSSTIEEP